MLNVLAIRIAKSIKSAAPDHPASEEVLTFSIASLINVISIVTSSLIISILTDRVGECSLALLSFAILRQISGGFHLQSGMLCILVSTAGATILSFAEFSNTVSLYFLVPSLILAAVFAPSGIENQSRIPKKFYPALKILSLLIILSNLIWQSPVIAASFGLQCLTLIRYRR